jgi:hypothetical protein
MPLLFNEAVPYSDEPVHVTAEAAQKCTTPLVTGLPFAVTFPVSVTRVPAFTVLAESVRLLIDFR